MTTEDKELEELIDGFNEEVIALKAQLALIKRKWEDASGDIQILFDIQPKSHEDGSGEVDGQCVNDLMRAINE